MHQETKVSPLSQQYPRLKIRLLQNIVYVINFFFQSVTTSSTFPERLTKSQLNNQFTTQDPHHLSEQSLISQQYTSLEKHIIKTTSLLPTS